MGRYRSFAENGVCADFTGIRLVIVFSVMHDFATQFLSITHVFSLSPTLTLIDCLFSLSLNHGVYWDYSSYVRSISKVRA